MTTYSARGFHQGLMPRGEELNAKVKMLCYLEGERLHNYSEPVVFDEMEGPNVHEGDKIVVLDYLNDIAAYWEIKYVKEESE
jgi:hypothetical protein